MGTYKKENTTSYTLGITLSIELLKTKPEVVKTVYFHTSFEQGNAYDIITSICKKNHIEVVTSNKIFNALSQKENCYVICEFYKFSLPIDLNENHVVLVNPSDPGNLGTIMRSMLGFGINNLAIIEPGVDHFNPKTVRSSMGAIFHMNVEYFKSFAEYQEHVSNRDYFPFMLKAKDTLPNIHKYKTKEVYSLIFGNEATGLPDEFLNIGTPIIIEHSKMIDSLNLTIAASIALYEVTKK